MQETDHGFYNRADSHIGLSNKQIAEGFSQDQVSTSFMFSVARFNAWVSASKCNNAADMKASKQEIMSNLIAEYQKMLEENMDDYIDNFADYMQTSE